MTMNDIIEEFSSETKTVSLVVPVKVCLCCSEFENAFSCSIDDAGQIVLTPNDVQTQFLSADVVKEDTEDTSVEEITCDHTLKTIYLHTTLLTDKEQLNISATVDELGQCVVYPEDDTSTFVTVGLGDSLNLVTEEFDGVTEYFGYKIIEKDGCYEVYDYSNNKIDCCDSLNKGKFAAIKNEYDIVANLCKEECAEDSSLSDIVDIINMLTNEFGDTCGVIVCDTQEEEDACEDILSKHYSNICCESVNDRRYVTYSNEDNDSTTKDEIILKILQGSMDLFEMDGKLLDKYIELTELNTKDYKFYYDPESQTAGYIVVKED